MSPATVVIGLILLLFVLWSLRSYIRKLRTGCCGGGDGSVRPADAHVSHYPCHLALRVSGMHCAGCARRIESTFNSRPGTMARVNARTGRADIYTMEPLEATDACALIARAGYGASPWEQAG